MGTAIGGLIEKQEIGLSVLAGRKVGVDSYNIIYQFLSSIRGPDGTPLMDSKGNVTSHLTGLLYRTTNLLEKGVKPVFVFDGAPPELKKQTLAKRSEIRTDAFAKHEKALKEGNLEDARKFGSRALKLTPEMIDDAKFLLGAMGLPVVQAPSDGEAQVAYMAKKGDVYGCVSQDFDALLFGAPVVFRNIAITGRRKVAGKNFYVDVSPEKIVLEDALKQLGINRQKLIWLGILIGTDFNEKFPKIGPKTALKLVQQHNSFDGIIKETKFEPDFDYHEVEKIFLEPSCTPDYTIEFSPPDRDAVVDFLCNRHDFSKDRVESALNKISEKSAEKGNQSRLDSWFK